MRLNSLEPNAHYDVVNGRPLAIERDNDGSTIVRFNITEKTEVPEGKKKAESVGYNCREIRIWDAPTKVNIKRAFIRSVIDESAEFDLVNSYNKHILAIRQDDAAVEAYKEFLAFTEDVDAAILEMLN